MLRQQTVQANNNVLMINKVLKGKGKKKEKFLNKIGEPIAIMNK